MVQHPQPTHRVLHQVTHDPVRGEQLRRRRNLSRPGLLLLPETGEDLGLALSDVELIEPADHLHVPAHLRGQRPDRLRTHRTVRQHVRGHEQGGVVTVGGEHERHRPVPVGAVCAQKQPIGLLLRSRTRDRAVQ